MIKMFCTMCNRTLFLDTQVLLKVNLTRYYFHFKDRGETMPQQVKLITQETEGRPRRKIQISPHYAYKLFPFFIFLQVLFFLLCNKMLFKGEVQGSIFLICQIKTNQPNPSHFFSR